MTNYQGSADPAGERNEAYRNEGNFKLTPIASGDLITAPCGQGATDSDFDGDGDIDVIAANRTGDVNILRNDGTGSFTLVRPASLGIRRRAADAITRRDIDSDGDLDMLLAGDNVGHLYFNRDDGAFAHRQSFGDTDGYMDGLADLDNDGDLDLAFAGDDIAYLNDGSGRFTAGPRIPVLGINDPRGIAFADIDADGDLDFAVARKRLGNQLMPHTKSSEYRNIRIKQLPKSPPEAERSGAARSDVGQYYLSLRKRADRMPKSFSYLARVWPDRDNWRIQGRAKMHELLAYDPLAGPMNAQVLESVQRDGYTRSLVRYSVTADRTADAFLLIPDNLKGPAPAVVAIHDHGGF